MSDETAVAPKVDIDVTQEWKKPRLLALLFCDYGALNVEGKVILAGAFDRFIFTEDEEKTTPPFFVFVRVAQATDGYFEIAIINPEGRPIASISYSTDPRDFDLNIPSYVQFLDRMQFHVPIEGVYWFNVSYRGETLGGAPLMVIFQHQEKKEDEHEGRDT